MREVQLLQQYERGFLPSKTPVVKVGLRLEEEAQKYIDWKFRHLANFEMATYKNYDKFIIETLDTYGLKDIARDRPVEWGWSGDGADLTKLRKQNSLGGRMLDIEAKSPITGELLFHDGTNPQGDAILKNYHTKEIANFMLIYGTNETKELYREHVHYYFLLSNKGR